MKTGRPAVHLQQDALAVGGGFVVFAALSGALAFFSDDPFAREGVVQPIAFNHLQHVEEEGLECSACHMHYERETYSGLPAASSCALCHLEAQGDSAEEARLVALLEEGAPLDWQPLFRQPPHVFFSHRGHVVVAAIECATCHGDIGASETPPTESRPLRMERCIACHEERGASTDCSACHR